MKRQITFEVFYTFLSTRPSIHHAHIYIYVGIYIYLPIYIYVCAYIYVYIYTYTYIYVCAYNEDVVFLLRNNINNKEKL